MQVENNAREVLKSMLRDYVNNYLTIAKFAEHNGLHPDQAERLLELASDVAETNHPEA